MGAAPSTVQAESGTTSVFKALARAQRTGKFTPKLLERLAEVLPQADEFIRLLRAGIGGDNEAEHALDEVGSWEVMHMFYPAPVPYNRTARITLERAAMRPYILASQEKCAEAVDYMLADPLISLYLWDEAVDVLRRITEFSQLKIVQSAVVLETELSALAALDAEMCFDLGTESMFECLLPETSAKSTNPAGLLFAWFKTEHGFHSMGSVLSHRSLREVKLTDVTLKRWSSGKHCISSETFHSIVSAISDEDDLSPAWARYWAARVLNLIGYVGQHCQANAKLLALTPHSRALAPWPAYPFGYPSFSEWSRVRYRYWFNYHSEQVKRLEFAVRLGAPRL
jgi:hypothetical protein